MWVEITKTYTGRAGVFAGGEIVDLPASSLKQMEGYHKPASSPYEGRTAPLSPAAGKKKSAGTPSDKQLHPGKNDRTK